MLYETVVTAASLLTWTVLSMALTARSLGKLYTHLVQVVFSC